ncbi:hypothetical protein HMN09_00792800 [Mycena chlorophos]|uniref:SURP motif domain-containing protein n=1 Tax=Mycena chlorophos TaxID=658473 RepID=A0A8H6SU39_MYCCL|nr:hypothetical protein HMN09_00792800 [Mycena chlorophos]
MASRKRKHRPGRVPTQSNTDEFQPAAPNPALFIQAYEADVRRGPQARIAAESLELATHSAGDRGLIEWKTMSSEEPIWVDRYDARLLLDTLPTRSERPPTPPSPSGWSDLPSDTEDMFFLSPEEVQDYRREKRRKLIDQAREDRVKARRAEDGEPEEDPDEPQRQLMERTAKSLVSADNPAQLEMRVLANYGADKRFAFLRGRWKRVWVEVKRDAKTQKDAEAAAAEAKAASAGGLAMGNLADYGDSESDSDSGEPKPELDAMLAARQARAKAWSESRKTGKS